MANTTPFVLTQRKSTYPHDQVIAQGPVKVASAVFDAAAVAAYKGSAVAANDVTQLITIPAGAFVLGVHAKVLTVEGGTCTVDIGDGDTVDGYIDGLNGNTSANSFSFDAGTTDAFTSGKFYAAADTIDVKLITGTATVVKIALAATYIMVASALTA
jgi:hypothetical protein